MGCLSTHQETCADERCPCLYVEEIQKKRKIEQEIELMENMTERALNEKKCLIVQEIEVKGNYLYEFSTDREVFKQFIMQFIDYHLSSIIEYLSKTKQVDVLQSISINFWFFLCKCNNNFIKALYKSKQALLLIKAPSLYFQVIERALTSIIENEIKEKDKANLYSYKLKESDSARMYIKFENLVNSEVTVQYLKTRIAKIIDLKIEWFNSLIEGYTSFDPFQKDTLKLISAIEDCQKQIHKELINNSDNVHYLKMLSLIRARVFSDPVHAQNLDQQINDIQRRDSILDKSTVSSINIMSGNTGTIIASFRTEKDQGKILNFSSRTPEIFGYDRQTFLQLHSMKQLMPAIISDIHDLLIQRLIVIGQPKIMRQYRLALAKLRNGFSQDIKLYVNYYFQISNEFAFSALCLKPSQSPRIIFIDEFGYIHSINEEFAQFINCKIDPNAFINLHISLFFPKFTEFLRNFDEKAGSDLNFLKFLMNFPPPDQLESYFQDYKEHHSIIQEKQFETKKQKSNEIYDDMEDFIDCGTKAMGYLNLGDPKYDAICNLVEEHIPLINGEILRAFIIQIDQTVFIDDMRSTSQSQNIVNTVKTSKIQQQEKELQQLEQEELQKQKNELIDFVEDFKKDKEETQLDEIALQLQQQQESSIQQFRQKQQSITDSNQVLNQKNDDIIERQPEEGDLMMKSNFASSQAKYSTKIQTMDMDDNKQFPLVQQDEYDKQDTSQGIKENINSFTLIDEGNEGNEQIQDGNEFIEQDVRGNEEQSVNSSMQSVEKGTIKQINVIAQSKLWPRELKMLYCSFILQLIIFVIILVILVIFFQYSFDKLTDCISQEQLLSRFMLPPINAQLSLNMLNLLNQQYLDMKNTTQTQQLTSFHTQQIEYINSEYGVHFNDLLRKKVIYNHQELFLKYGLKNVLIKNEQVFTSNIMPLTEYIKLQLDLVYDYQNPQYVSNQDQKLGTFYNDHSYTLINNFPEQYKLLQEHQNSVMEDVNSLENDIKGTNVQSFILAIVLIIWSFIFILPGFTKLRQRIERICQVVSRTTEQEAIYQIESMEIIQGYLLSHKETFLHCIFTNYTDSNSKISKTSSRVAKKTKKGSNRSNSYLNERIHSQNLNYTFIYIIMFLLFLLSCSFFIVIFVYVSSFGTIFDPIQEDQENFYQASSEFAMMLISHRLILLNRLNLSEPFSNVVNENIFSKYKSLEDSLHLSSKQYFTSQFMKMGMENRYTDSFKQKLEEIVSQDVCQNQLIESFQQEYCKTSNKGDLQRGFSLSMKSTYNIILNQDFDLWSDNQINTYILSEEFVSDSSIQTISLHILNKLSDLLIQEINDIRDQFLNSLSLIYIVGALVYCILFVILVIYYLTKLVKEYMVMKKAIQLIPYKRLCEDQTTHHLLKRIFNF